MTVTTLPASPADGSVAALPASPVPRLGVLFTYENGEKAAARGLSVSHARGIPSVVDSGAWSVFNSGATIDPARQAAWINDISPDFPEARFLGLDVIGDEEASFRNWMLQRELGAPVEPTVHYPAPPEMVTRYVDEGLATGWINFGGMVAASSRPSWIRPTMAWIAACRRRVPDGVKFHALGMTTPAANDLVRFDGVDSSYWLVSLARYRMLPLFNPARRRWERMSIATAKPVYERESRASFRGLGALLRAYYDVSPGDVWEMTDDDRFGLSVRSHGYFADTYRARHASPGAPLVYLAGAPTKADHPVWEHVSRWFDSDPTGAPTS